MKKVHLAKPSAKQASRLRNGHSVRIKKGSGVCMVVNPSTYNTVSRAFGANRGVQINLSPQEILANATSEDPEITGGNIFKKIRKGLKRTGKKVAHELVDIGQVALPGALAAGAAAGATALGAPAAAPVAAMVAGQAGNIIADDLASVAHKGIGKDRRRKAPPNRSGVRSTMVDNTLKKQAEQNETLQSVNNITGQNLGYMGNSGLGTLLANSQRANTIDTSVADMFDEALTAGMPSNEFAGDGLYAGAGMGYGLYAGQPLYVGNGLYAGRGLYAGMGMNAGGRMVIPTRTVGGQIGGRHAPVLPPALQSQPYSANFQFQHTLPPAFQSIGDRSGGRGLYA